MDSRVVQRAAHDPPGPVIEVTSDRTISRDEWRGDAP